MKKPLRSVLACLLGSLLVASPAWCQEEEQSGQGEEQPRGSLRVHTDMEKLFTAYGFTHGGQEGRRKLLRLESLEFVWIPHEVSDAGTRELAPIDVTVQLKPKGNARFVRLEEEIDGAGRTKIANDLGQSRVWVDGKERQVPELVNGAATEARLLYMLLDLVYRPEADDLRSVFDGEFKRDGKPYLAASYEFHASRTTLANFTYRLYYAKDSGLVERIDVHTKDDMLNRRIQTYRLSEYVPVEEGDPKLSLKFPSRIEIQSREGTTLGLWRFADAKMDPELSPATFAGP